jgi:hypothetical protein
LPFTKSHAGPTSVLIDEFNASPAEHGLNKFKRSLVAGISSDFDVRNRIAVKTGRIRKLANRPI